MKAIMVMFDTLNRHCLPNYGCEWIHAPNFKRLGEKTVTFDNSYVGSMPCMPARRELHTGRYNFLHRSWGPMEPFDDSMPEQLYQNGIRSHLISDHYHYWEDGGATYHTRFSTWEITRGQEGDPWKCVVKPVDHPESLNGDRGPWGMQDWINREYMKEIDEFSQGQTFKLGCEFIETNHCDDNWFLQIETFDPHEPYYSHQSFKDLYPHDYDGPHFDWPGYRPLNENDTEERIQHLKYEYAALVSMCDYHLGRILDLMDKYNMWKDTMLIVNTDHGFLHGEHGWWAKCRMPFYNEIAHTPLFVWDPGAGIANERRSSLVQTIDLAPTVLEFFNIDRSQDMQGVPLKSVITDDQTIHPDGILYGVHGGHVNYTDGRYVYMRAPVREDNSPLFEYTLMPTRHGSRRAFFQLERLQDIEIRKPFTFTKNCQTMKINSNVEYGLAHEFGTLMFDLENDPKQESPLSDAELENELISKMKKLMKANDAPTEQYERLGL